MDRYRVQSLRKLLGNGLSGAKREWAIETLERKISVLCQGARKRGKEYEATAFEGILLEVLEETLDVGDGDSPICERQGIPSADS